MNGLGSAGEPSMEEILASIRKIIADDTDGLRLTRAGVPAPAPGGFGEAPSPGPDESPMSFEHEMDLPSILRPAPPAAPERSGVLNRLADALRGGPAAPAARGAEPARSLEEDLADLLEGPAAQAASPAAPLAARAPIVPPVPIERADSGPQGDFPASIPQAQQLFAKLDASLALLTEQHLPRDRLRELVARTPLVPVGHLPETSTGAPFPGPAASEDSGPVVIAGMPSPGAPAAPDVPPVLAELVRSNGGSKAARQSASTGKAKAPSRPESANGGERREATNKARSTPAKAAGPAAAASEPHAPVAPAGTNRTSVESALPSNAPATADVTPPPVAAGVMDKARASVISAAEFFVNGVAGSRRGAAPDGEHVQALDDTVVAELLRPMLRQWMAENMPRIMEAALRAEAANTEPGGKKPDRS